MAEKRLLKELKQLSLLHVSTTNPQILDLRPKLESLFSWTATVAKPLRNDSPYYYNGQWDLDIEAGLQYPLQPPTVRFSAKTPIFHPNVKMASGEICLDILKSDSWLPAWNLANLVGAILMLIDDPEPDSPLDVDLANLYRCDKVAFESMAQYVMWKHNTFYEGAKEASGVKSVGILGTDNSEEDEAESELESMVIVGPEDAAESVELRGTEGKAEQSVQEAVEEAFEKVREQVDAPDLEVSEAKEVLDEAKSQAKEVFAKVQSEGREVSEKLQSTPLAAGATKKALETVDDATKKALDTIDEATKKTLEIVGEATKKALESVDEATNKAQEVVERAKTQATAFVEEAKTQGIAVVDETVAQGTAVVGEAKTMSAEIAEKIKSKATHVAETTNSADSPKAAEPTALPKIRPSSKGVTRSPLTKETPEGAESKVYDSQRIRTPSTSKPLTPSSSKLAPSIKLTSSKLSAASKASTPASPPKKEKKSVSKTVGKQMQRLQEKVAKSKVAKIEKPVLESVRKK